MKNMILATFITMCTLSGVIIGGVLGLHNTINAQTAQLNEIITHIDGLNKSQNDILTFCNMGD